MDHYENYPKMITIYQCKIYDLYQYVLDYEKCRQYHGELDLWMLIVLLMLIFVSSILCLTIRIKNTN